jgi:hypothetical protein
MEVQVEYKKVCVVRCEIIPRKEMRFSRAAVEKGEAAAIR